MITGRMLRLCTYWSSTYHEYIHMLYRSLFVRHVL
jgi:hypothetical protein